MDSMYWNEIEADVTGDLRSQHETGVFGSSTSVSSSGMYNYEVIRHMEEIILFRVYL